ncbi:MAG: methionyl-tRNA formyltransferase [Christensenellaceae bacterium]|nr:methionyl-tRNA formyltransferase [Christensenellaceae bacterium]MEA5068154.1 methionyl-tRNA formyltransferase [Christensenellaceae bacterium]
MRIVFMGTPEFAVPSLRALLDAGYEVVGAFTQPDRPAGRGKKVIACPVKRLAEARGVPVFQPERIKRADGLEMLKALSPDLCVTAAFGQLLSKENLAVPKLGTVNVHASLLPRHRGAAPINWAILLGDRVTGVTTMFTDEGLDTGDMILKAETEIGAQESAGELTQRLSALGARVLIDTLRAIEAGNCPRERQDASLASYEPLLTKEMGRMDFHKPPEELALKARALDPWPGAFAMLPEGPLKVWRAKATEGDWRGVPGQVVAADAKRGLIVMCGQGALELTEIQAPNAKRMDARAYLRGKAIQEGLVLNG